MGRRTRAGKIAKAAQQRTDRWAVSLWMLFAFLIMLPVSGVVLTAMERFGTDVGSVVEAAGTASVTSCEHHVLGTPYTCTAEVTWESDSVLAEPPPTQETVYSMSLLSGEVAVQEFRCSYRRHHCRIYTTGFPHRSGATFIPPVIVMLVLMITGLYGTRRLAKRIVGKPAEPTV
ncbi:hypothetical protein [Actinoplanes sp. NPDC051851]|uniref:hypothetical protein n=1 Tax=Actinoplanes sp. NPDC051851 TaxID=3154753 RepID=UPI003432E01E